MLGVGHKEMKDTPFHFYSSGRDEHENKSLQMVIMAMSTKQDGAWPLLAKNDSFLSKGPQGSIEGYYLNLGRALKTLQSND